MHHLIYVFDSYCGWCYGFGPAIRERAARDDIFVEVRHGSLFGGDRAASLGAFAHIPQANARIAALTGARFGEGYQRLLESGEVVLNSDHAARGLAALRSVVGSERDVDAAGALQQAFYQEGLSLSEADTYRWIAGLLGADPDRVVAAFEDADVAAAARAEQAWVDAAGIGHYPTLLAVTPRGLVEVGNPTATAQELLEAVQQVA